MMDTLPDVGRAARNTLQALTAAAALLPGLAMGQVALGDFELQYGQLQEDARHLPNAPNNQPALQVDSLHSRWGITLNDRAKLTLNYAQDTWSGATPITTAPLPAAGNRPIRQGSADNLVVVGASPFINSQISLDRNGQPLQRDGALLQPNQQLVHTLSSASPETRRELDGQLTYAWDDTRLELGSGVSRERDYRSQFYRLGGQWDFNQKLTTLRLGVQTSSADIAATLDHDAAPYITKTAYAASIERSGSREILRGDRRDHALDLGLTQVLSPLATLDVGIGLTHSRGYLANPYKLMTVIFVDPPSPTATVLNGNVQALLEQRPDHRRQTSLGGHYSRYFPALDAAWHLRYQYSRDTWGIRAHAVETEWAQPLGGGWTVTPRLRYYTQTAATFYQPYLLSQQAYRTVLFDADNNVRIVPFDPGRLPAHFSSDQRLAGFGSLQTGITVSKQLDPGVRLLATVEHYRQAGALKWGGNGIGGYADTKSWLVSAALKVDLTEPATRRHADDNHHVSHGPGLPAGVMDGHSLPAGAWMVGYRFMLSRDAGSMLRGTAPVGDAQLLSQGCGGTVCYSAASRMSMRMHMLELMYAPRDGLTLMLMPQWTDMQMAVRGVNGAPAAPLDVHVHNAPHDTGGLGDTVFAALLELAHTPRQRWQLGLGLTAPTGAVDLKLRRSHQIDPGLTHYGMQLGSGTWDFKPSLTHLRTFDRWVWGSQLNATLRLQNRNSAGFAFGNLTQATTWGSYQLAPGLAASLRAVYTVQGALRGEYGERHPHTSPMDFPTNYGGRYADLGFGLNVGNLAVEWLQPIRTQVNGYQLDREGSLALSWHQMF